MHCELGPDTDNMMHIMTVPSTLETYVKTHTNKIHAHKLM